LREARKRKWKYTLILEDDAKFYYGRKATPALRYAESCIDILESNGGFDVFMLGGYVMGAIDEGIREYRKIAFATMSHAYVVSADYATKLEICFSKAIRYDVQIDLMWFELQQKDRWYISNPALVGQIESASDIKNDDKRKKVIITTIIVITIIIITITITTNSICLKV